MENIMDPDPDPWKILWIRIQIWENDADPLDLDLQHCFKVSAGRQQNIFFL